MIFVSYSHGDASIVEPLVEFLRVSRSSVFRDTDSIPPGTKWRLEIASALENSEIVIVFWCRHSAQSKEVEMEYLRAIELDKPVVPILLDSTPLSDVLAQFQWIDLRTTLGGHEVGEPPPLRAGGFPGGLYLRQPSANEFQSAGQYLVAQLYARAGQMFPSLQAGLATLGVISQDQPTEFGASFGIYLETMLRRMKKQSSNAERLRFIQRQIGEMHLEDDDRMQIRHRMIMYLCQELSESPDSGLTVEEHDQIKKAREDAQEKYLQLVSQKRVLGA